MSSVFAKEVNRIFLTGYTPSKSTTTKNNKDKPKSKIGKYICNNKTILRKLKLIKRTD
jgi:hypothetical protein